MAKFFKLIVIKCGVYESEIIMECNLSSRQEAQAIMKEFKNKKDIFGLIADMHYEVGSTPLLLFA